MTNADCKICKRLEGVSGTKLGKVDFDKSRLFKNHMDKEVTQCPILLELTKKFRMDLCVRCSFA